MLDLPGSTATMMVKFAFAEMAGMILIYGAADGNWRQASIHLCAVMFVICWQLHHSMLAAIGCVRPVD
jgi:hypothetical protein